jgi:hypothetical protein
MDNGQADLVVQSVHVVMYPGVSSHVAMYWMSILQTIIPTAETKVRGIQVHPIRPTSYPILSYPTLSYTILAYSSSGLEARAG